MDDDNVGGQDDIASFDFTSTHRLPTVSAAQALEDIGADPTQFISTGLQDLDKALDDFLQPSSSFGGGLAGDAAGGFARGQVVEIWGPPGSGKTTLATQLVSNALKTGSHAVWVDGFYTASGQRLNDIITTDSQALDNVIHFNAPTLAHFISLLCKPTTRSIPPNTSIVVIDGLSALIHHAFPRSVDTKQQPKGAKPGPGLGIKRHQTLQFITTSLQKLAATKDLVVVILSQCVTRFQGFQGERNATLIPAINTTTWAQGMATRLVLFRDWVVKDGTPRSAHIASIQKVNGKVTAGAIGPVFAFTIHESGIQAMDFDPSKQHFIPSSSRTKRKLGHTGFEIGDSEDEDYGWQDDDGSELPAMPPQYQGSEDLLLGDPNGEGTDEEREIEDSDAPSDVEDTEDAVRPRSRSKGSGEPLSGVDGAASSSKLPS